MKKVSNFRGCTPPCSTISIANLIRYSSMVLLLTSSYFHGAESQISVGRRENCCPRTGPDSCGSLGTCDIACCNCETSCTPGIERGQEVLEQLGLFDQMDTDSDGGLTLNEIVNYSERKLYFSRHLIVNIEFEGYNIGLLFDLEDTNGDKKLDRDEFRNLETRVSILKFN